MRNLCSFLMDIQQFGVSVVFLLLCTDLTKALLNPMFPESMQFHTCTWIVVIGLILLPFSWLGSPQDFTPVAFAAMGCTAISCVLVLIIYISEGISPSNSLLIHTFSYQTVLVLLDNGQDQSICRSQYTLHRLLHPSRSRSGRFCSHSEERALSRPSRMT
jgi:amino acid permease